MNIAAIEELLQEYKIEADPAERENIARTISEIALNEPIELPTQTIQQWSKQECGA